MRKGERKNKQPGDFQIEVSINPKKGDQVKIEREIGRGKRKGTGSRLRKILRRGKISEIRRNSWGGGKKNPVSQGAMGVGRDYGEWKGKEGRGGGGESSIERINFGSGEVRERDCTRRKEIERGGIGGE